MNKALLQELLQLTPAERVELALDLWESIPPGAEGVPPLSDDQKAELERRLVAYQRDPTRGSSWEKVRARLEARFR